MTEKNAVKSETVSPAREFRLQWSHKPTPIPLANETSELWYSETCAEQMMDAYASHVSSLSSQAIGAAAKEAAEKIMGHKIFCAALTKDDCSAIVLRAIEKARS